MIHPTSDNIIVEPINKKISEFIIVPPKYEYRNREFLSGRVVAVGPKVKNIEVDSELAYAKDFGREVDFEKKRLVFIKTKHILAIK